MKRKQIIGALIAIALAFVAFRLWAPGQAPRGQAPLETLRAAGGTFQAAFDADTDVPRVVLLLSPT